MAIILLLNAGCLSTSVSSLKTSVRANPDYGIILDVPFVEQKKEFCGPAALSSVFAFWQRPLAQEKIAGEIFRPELCGVLNIDLEKYARDKGFWAKGYQTDFEDLKNHLLKGMPVIVLEKLHPFILNRNHYTVITGFSQKHQAVIEHTGSRESVIRSYQGFKRNWYAGGGWMLKVVPFDKAGEMQNAQDNIELGTLLEKQGLLDEALHRYNAALKTEPENHIALFNIGNIHMRRQFWKQAETAYKQSIAFNENFSDAYNNLAYLYLKTGRYEQAHEYVDKAINLNADREFYYLDTKAQIFLAQKNISEALALLKQAVLAQQEVPDQLQIQFNRFWEEKIPQSREFLGEKKDEFQ